MLVTELCPTLCDPVDSLSFGILQARILKWVAIPFSRGCSWSRDWTLVSCIAVKFFTIWAIREDQCEKDFSLISLSYGFSGGTSCKALASQCKRHKRWGLDPWLGKTPFRRAWQPTPISLPGESPWTEMPGGVQSLGLQRVEHDWSDLAHMHARIGCARMQRIRN